MMFCPKCSHDNPVEALFCGNCGLRLDTSTTTATLPAPYNPVTSEVVAAPVLETRYVRYAGFWVRLLAAVVDISILIVVTVIASLLPMGSFGSSALFWVLSIAYFVLFTGLRGQTPGKMLVGIRVVDADGNQPGLARAAVRESFGKLCSGLVFYLGFLWVAWDASKQGWHDKLARTYVLRSRE